MKCCGVDRNSPFCPLCGSKLGKESPIAELLAYIRTQLKKAQGRERETIRYADLWKNDPQYGDKLKQVEQCRSVTARWLKWEKVVSAVVTDEHARVYADFLDENGFTEAAQRLRGAFS